MPRRADAAPHDASSRDDAVRGSGAAGPSGPSDAQPGPAGAPDLSGLPVAGITRRRLAFLVGAFVTVWIVVVFARQVGDASAATARAAAIQAGNEQLAAHVTALQEELRLIQEERFIVLQARGHRLGGPDEIPFTLGDAAPLPADAPGSVATRLGDEGPARTPLEGWLSLLFGPGR